MPTVTVPTRVVDLTYYEETAIGFANFTDGGSTSGTYQARFELPVGFFVEYCQLVDLVGFSGDTTAAMIVGDGSDTDRYMAGTPSVLTTTSRLHLGVPSGIRFIATANRPTITITGAADFTSISAGSFTIRVYGYVV
jgi:hypothetical protein